LSTSRFTPVSMFLSFFFQAEDGIRDFHVTGVQTCALPISEATAGPRGLPRKVTTTDNTTRSGPFIQVGPLRSRLHQVAEGRAGAPWTRNLAYSVRGQTSRRAVAAKTDTWSGPVSTHFNVGISGAGTIGRIHAEALRIIDTASLVAVAEPRADAGKAFAEEFGCAHYDSVADMLSHDSLDVVIIATPSGMHPDQAVLAAQAGKHIITEKPMAITKEGLDGMIAAASDAGVHLAVIFQNRLSTDVLIVKRAIEQGALGTPVLANGAMYWHRTDEYY